MGSNKSKIAFEICIVSGDYKKVEDPPGIFMVLFDEEQHQSPTLSYTDLIQIEEGKIEAKFSIENKPWCKLKNFNKLQHIELWRSNDVVIPYDWYLDKVIIRDRRTGLRGYWEYFFFPVHRWLESGRHYVVYDCETFKAHEDPFNDLRIEDIHNQQSTFGLFQRSGGFPVEVDNIPEDEIFSDFNKWDIENATHAAISQRRLNGIYEDKSNWHTLEELNSFYTDYNITEPIGVHQSILDDICFGAQRLKGCNPLVLRLCTQIPDNFEVTDEWLKPHLEGWTVAHIIKARRLYIVDYSIMDGLDCKPDRVMPCPLALFFITETKLLRPLAIQLTQNRETGNLVFLPSDPPGLWTLAKMWFNLTDACHHMVVGRLVNQMVLENIYVSLRRNFSQSHPVYQILAPHFHHCLIVSKTLKEFVFDKSGWIARNIQLSKKGVKQLVKRAFKHWSFDVNANIHNDLQKRQVYDIKALNNYPYRDDALLVHAAITNYIRRLVKLFYPNGRKDMLEDIELQNFRRELAAPMKEGGMGLSGIPGGENSKPQNGYMANHAGTMDRVASMSHLNGGGSAAGGAASVFSGVSEETQKNGIYVPDDLVKLLTGAIHMSVIMCGSGLRLPMYDEYGYPLNYPLQLIGSLPQDPADELRNSGDLDDIAANETVVAALPSKHATLDVLITVRMAARVTQSVLGKFDSDYLYRKEALAILEDFRKELIGVHEEIEKRNGSRDIFHQYYCMDPALLPNHPGV